MQQPGLIADYLDALALELSFDRSLSRRVRDEVEDHLYEALAADPTGDAREAERRAIARFGQPRAIAADFAATSLTKQTKSAALMAPLFVLFVYVAMIGRIAWWGRSDTLLQWSVAAIIRSIDRYGFWVALIVGLAGWAYSYRLRVSMVFDADYRRRLKRSFVLSVAAAAVLVTSVISDSTLVGLRIWWSGWSLASLVPLLGVGIEIALAAILVAQMRAVMHRGAATALLLHL